MTENCTPPLGLALVILLREGAARDMPAFYTKTASRAAT